MTTKQRYEGIIAWFSEQMPVAESELHYDNAYQLLVAVILSAQCTDKRVNMTTLALFERFPTPFEMAQVGPEEIYPYIRSISYPNNKARNLAAMARMLCGEFGGEVPSDLEQMQRLPGVGRKTANVLGAVLWQKEVMPVDTHVFRVSNRIGLTTDSKTPLQTERTLEKYIPSHLLPLAHHWLILHGRYVCVARKPKCAECGIALWCRKYAADRKASAVEGSAAGAGSIAGESSAAGGKSVAGNSAAVKRSVGGRSAAVEGSASPRRSVAGRSAAVDGSASPRRSAAGPKKKL